MDYYLSHIITRSKLFKLRVSFVGTLPTKDDQSHSALLVLQLLFEKKYSPYRSGKVSLRVWP